MDEIVPNAAEIARRDIVNELSELARGERSDSFKAASLLALAIEATLSSFPKLPERKMAEQLALLLRLDDRQHQERRHALSEIEDTAAKAWLESMRDEEAEQDEEADRRFYQTPRPFGITGRFG